MTDWLQQLDYFSALTPEKVSMFAPPREMRGVLNAYNKALDDLKYGEFDRGLKLINKIAADFPMFVEASHLYGIALAVKKDYPRADKFLQQAALLDISDEGAEIIGRQREALRAELKKVKRQNVARKKQDELLSPVRKSLALGGILEKAPKAKRGGKGWSFATSEEREELLKQKPDQVVDLFGEEEQQDRRKTIITAAVSIGAAVLVLVLFFAVIRPAILKRRAATDTAVSRVEWLENEMNRRRSDDAGIQSLYDDYQKWLSESITENEEK